MTSDATTILSQALRDRYRILRELGSGGMATVFLAEDLRHDRHVAVKVLRQRPAWPNGRRVAAIRQPFRNSQGSSSTTENRSVPW